MKTDFDFTEDVSIKIYKDGNLFVNNSDGNRIYFKNFNGVEKWYEYATNNNKIHFKDSRGYEKWWDVDGNRITKEEYDSIHNPCAGKTVTIDGKDYTLVLKDV